VPVAGVDAGVTFGAAPVVSSDAPTAERPEVESAFDVVDDAGDDVIEEMPLISPVIPSAARPAPGKRA
jgi:hypothetical protein